MKVSKSKRFLGIGFSDELAKVTTSNKSFPKGVSPSWQDNLIPNFNPNFRVDLEKSFWRVTIFFGLAILIFFALFVRLFHLQIVDGKNNRVLADGNRVQVRVIHAPRGVIYDRNGKVLAANSPGFRLVEQESKKTIFVSREEAFELEVKNDPRAAYLEIDNIRKYPYGEVAAHVIGYVGEISEEQLRQPQFHSYRLGDRIGQSGIESYYEDILKGVDGGEIIEVDSRGNKLRSLRTVAPIAGQNVYLTVDIDLQKEAYKSLSEAVKKSGSCCGALVAQDPQTGQVLTLLSYPSYNNNLFTSYERDTQVADILNDRNSPTLNRAIAGTYPPGSTFKIISALAALGSNKFTEASRVEDSGQIFLGSFRFTNWYFTQYGRLEGSVDLVKALQRSNDIFFYRVGEVVGEKVLGEYAKKIKLGSELGIDLYGEEKGLVPDNDWKVKTYGQGWYPGDSLHMAIGQGFVLTTPLQVLGFTSLVAADGNLFKPHLLLKVVKDEAVVVKQPQPEVLVAKVVSRDHLKLVKSGLQAVPMEGGTAWPFFTFPIPTAGKTGTAEYGDPKGKTHAWYTSYAPVDDPKIVMTVLIEGGGEGSSVASPVAKEIYRWFFSENKGDLIKDKYQIATDSAKPLGE